MCSDGSMSTVDPDAARRARAARVPTIKDLFVPGILAFAGAGGLMTCVLMMAREPAADEVSAHTGWLLVAMTGALIGGLAAIVGLIFWVRLSVKNLRLPGWAAPIALVTAGAGAGCLLNAGPIVLGVSLLGVSVLFAVLAVVGLRRRTTQASTEEEIVRGSDPVDGTVTNQGYTHFGESTRILTAVTYSFVDGQGTQRFVRRGAVIDVADPLVEGESVDVWFDRTNPADEKRIVVRRRRG